MSAPILTSEATIRYCPERLSWFAVIDKGEGRYDFDEYENEPDPLDAITRLLTRFQRQATNG